MLNKDLHPCRQHLNCKVSHVGTLSQRVTLRIRNAAATWSNFCPEIGRKSKITRSSPAVAILIAKFEWRPKKGLPQFSRILQHFVGFLTTNASASLKGGRWIFYWGTPNLDGGTRPPYNLSTVYRPTLDCKSVGGVAETVKASFLRRLWSHDLGSTDTLFTLLRPCIRRFTMITYFCLVA